MSSETRQRVNENGRVVIPASFRKALGINVGDEIVLRIEDDELRITTLKHRIERAQRLVRQQVKPGTSLVTFPQRFRDPSASNCVYGS